MQSQNTLLHNLLIVDSVSYVNVRLKRYVGHRWVQIKYVRWAGWRKRVKVRVDPLDKGRLPGACHTYGDDHNRFRYLG
jgi:hypothetical protein